MPSGPTPLTADALALKGVRHAYFTREGGVSRGLFASLNTGTRTADDPAAVEENHARVTRHMGVPREALVTLTQVHSAVAHTVSGPTAERAEADALVTAAPGVALGVRTADCAPVLFADPAAGVIGAAHAGWRGAVGGILEATLAAMVAAGARVGEIVAAIGPTIAKASYEVGPEVREAAERGASDLDVGAHFEPSARPERFMFDLPGYIAARLAAAGVATVADVAADTYAQEDLFFSYRRRTHRGEDGHGSLLSAIVLTGPGE